MLRRIVTSLLLTVFAVSLSNCTAPSLEAPTSCSETCANEWGKCARENLQLQPGFGPCWEPYHRCVEKACPEIPEEEI